MQEVGAGDAEGQVRWKQQLCLRHARLRSSSTAVLEVHFYPLDAIRPLEPNQGAASEVIAWAYTKLLQVCCCCVLLTLLLPLKCCYNVLPNTPLSQCIPSLLQQQAAQHAPGCAAQ